MSTPTPTTQGTQGAGNNVANNPAFWNFLGSVATAAGNIAATAIGSGSQQTQQGGPASASGLAPVQMTGPGNNLFSEIRPFMPIILVGVGVLFVLILAKNLKKP